MGVIYILSSAQSLSRHQRHNLQSATGSHELHLLRGACGDWHYFRRWSPGASHCKRLASKWTRLGASFALLLDSCEKPKVITLWIRTAQVSNQRCTSRSLVAKDLGSHPDVPEPIEKKAVYRKPPHGKPFFQKVHGIE